LTKREVTIVNPAGLHARPAAQLVTLCKTFSSNITIYAENNRNCDAKRLLKVLQCCIKKGETITVHADGNDEEDAVDAVADLISSLSE